MTVTADPRSSRLAPVDQGALDRALQTFGRSTMLPAGAYTDPAVLAWERRHFVAGSWACLGRESELAVTHGRTVTQRGVMVGDVPVLLTFAPDGDVRAFANTCRHRGHELLGDGGTADARAVSCPYHAWSFGLDGRLIAAPGFKDVDGFDAADYPLADLPVARWGGWLFVNATGDAAPFAEHLGGMAELIDPYRPETLQVMGRHAYEVAANWKLIVENYHECYHCPSIHPELCQVSPPDSGDNWDLPGAWVGGSMDLMDFAETMSLDGRSRGVRIEGVDPRRVLYVGLFPNLLVSAHPDYVMTHRINPLAPDRTWVECTWLFPEGTKDPSFAVEFWDITNREDWGACESVQRGLASPHFRPGPFAPIEDAVHQWVQMVGRGYRGVPPHAPAL